jgi:hypothetical protein
MKSTGTVFTCDEGGEMATDYTGSLFQICEETGEYQDIDSFLRQPFSGQCSKVLPP